MKSIYAKRGLATLGDRRRPETLGEKFARWARGKLRRKSSASEPELSLRDSTRPENPSAGLRGETKPENPCAGLRKSVDPYSD